MKTTAIALTVLLGLGCISCETSNANTREAKGQKAESHSGKKGKNKSGKGDQSEVTVLKTWSLPPSLLEVSGIALDGSNRFACVQDEEGKIFVFNTATNQIEKEVPFAGPGDYEGIAVVGSTAWVLRADGLLFEVQNYAGGKPTVTEHRTPMTVKNDLEGLSADPGKNRLLISVKEQDPNSSAYKGVYAFDLGAKKLSSTPVFKIASSETAGSKKSGGAAKPSEIELHPTTGDLYVLDGPGSRLIILGKDGAEKAVYALGKSDFPQPEGMVITGEGDLYISNEGKKGQGTILKVSVGAQQN